MAEISISTSLVVYKPDLKVLERTLLALQKSVEVAKRDYVISLNLTLVDNSCDERLHEQLKKWIESHLDSVPDLTPTLLRASGNIGYGRGNNLVIEQSKSDYHLVLNPDLFLEPDALTQSLGFMEINPDVGLLSPAIFAEDGERQYLCKRNPTLFIMFLRSFSPDWIQSRFQSTLTKFEMRDCNYDDIIDGLQYPSGCCMFFRTGFLQQINGFDPDYFLHFEDADIGRRMLKIARVVYVPSVRALHKWARGTHHSWKMRLITVWSGLIYWRKWGGTFVSSSAKNLVSLTNKYKTKSEYEPKIKFGKRILVTGANGFVGKAICEELLSEGFKVRGVVRQILPDIMESEVEYLPVGDINEITDWSSALIDVEVIIHLAGRVHVMHDTADNPLAEFLRVNVVGTEHLMKCAVANGVKRIVYVSSIKVNGELTHGDHKFSEADPPLPRDDYGVSKWTAEQMLHGYALDTGLEVVVIRPPLVYGPAVKANFLLLMRWVDYGIPLPFGSIKNERSLLFLGNLVNALIVCATHPAAVGQTYLVSDAERVSTPQLFASMANALGRPLRVFPFPVSIIRFVAGFIGKSAEIDRLTRSLVIDSSKIRNELGWYPIYTMEQGLAITADWYRTPSKSLPS